jgi:hypothetical protein
VTPQLLATLRNARHAFHVDDGHEQPDCEAEKALASLMHARRRERQLILDQMHHVNRTRPDSDARGHRRLLAADKRLHTANATIDIASAPDSFLPDAVTALLEMYHAMSPACPLFARKFGEAAVEQVQQLADTYLP